MSTTGSCRGAETTTPGLQKQLQTKGVSLSTCRSSNSCMASGFQRLASLGICTIQPFSLGLLSERSLQGCLYLVVIIQSRSFRSENLPLLDQVMSQQTQVPRAAAYWQRWIEKWPTVQVRQFQEWAPCIHSQQHINMHSASLLQWGGGLL